MSKTFAVLFVYVFELLTSFCFFSRIYEKKQKSVLLNLLIGLFLFIPSSLIFSTIGNEVLNLIVFFAINVFYARICYNITLKNAVIQSIILDVFMFSTEIITIFLLSSALHIPTKQYKNDIHLFIIIALICKMVYFILAQFLSMVIIKLGHKNNGMKQFLPLFIFPVLSIASCTIFLYIALKTEVSLLYRITTTVVCILYILASVFVFVYYQTLANKDEKLKELESEKRMYSLNKNYLEILEHQNNELQMMFHDTKHHYMALSNFDDINDVKAYISKIYTELEEKNIIKVSNNKMLDLILSKYIVYCKKNNIKFEYEVKTANLDYIDDAELSIILNNVLDNAVEAAKISSERCIEFSLRHINGMDLLSCINSCDVPPKHSNHQLLTTKFDSTGHGFGTKIIKKARSKKQRQI